MDRQAFKQRMQNLKSYRENNPGKGYWDWKVTAYADGGEVKDDRTDHSIAKPIIPENIERIVNGKPWSQLSAQEQFMNRSGYSYGRPLERGLELVHPEFDILSSVRGVSSTVKGLMDTVIGRKLPTDYAYRRTTANELKDIVDSNSFRSIPDNVNLPTKTITTASGKTITFGKKKGNSHGVKAFSAREPWKATTASGDKANEIIIGIPGDNAKWMTGFHGNYKGPFNFKDINKGTGIAVPFNEQGIADISTKGLKVFGKPSKYFNDRYLAYADGGQTGDPDKERFYQATGRSSSGRPLEEGLKPVFSLEDAANMTPIGDAISARDTYNAVKNRDWLGAGLAALTVIPFVPNAIKRVTPIVRRTGTDQIDRILRAQNKEAKMATRLNNETYNIAERLMDDPSYMRRAQQVKNKYGDDYTSIYADIINAYNESPELLPKAKGSLSLGEARGKMQTQGSATTRHKEGGDFPKIGEYDYMFNIDRGVPYGGTTHEINHFSDFLKNQSPDAVGSSNMYKWMRSAIKPYSDSVSKYFSSPTEQKAYMNQLREFMYANKMIDTRDQVVTPSLIKTALDKLPKGMDSVKKASDQFKSLKSYTKWFNTVPLLGVGAIGANKYFTNNESRN